MKVITLCGSLKFQKEMMSVAEKMALEGGVYFNTCLSNIKEYRKNRRTIRKIKRRTF